MNWPMRYLLISSSLILTLGVTAQDTRPDRRPGPGMRPGEHSGGERGPGFHGPAGSPNKNRRPLDAYMNRLKENDPAAFDELQRLKEEDPAAFRERLGQRLNQGEFKNRFKDFPEMADLLNRLPEERRREMIGRFMMRGGGGGHEGFNSSEDKDAKRKDYEKINAQFTQLAKAYRDAEDDAARDAIREDVTQHVARIFESRQAERRKHIEKLRQELGKLEQMMGDDDAKRSEMIQRRVDDMLKRFSQQGSSKPK
ncbi:MAG: hypothetical protein ACI9TH_000275 [Kiritimatiellia bacterium]|jgi:hypothetical protein